MQKSEAAMPQVAKSIHPFRLFFLQKGGAAWSIKGLQRSLKLKGRESSAAKPIHSLP